MVTGRRAQWSRAVQAGLRAPHRDLSPPRVSTEGLSTWPQLWPPTSPHCCGKKARPGFGKPRCFRGSSLTWLLGLRKCHFLL